MNRAYSPDDYALLALANEARANNNLSPYVWSNDLAKAAKAHSDDATTNGCFQHNSCNGELWSKRISRYYPGWFTLAENIANGSADPRNVHDSWMHSTGHRMNILGGHAEFGAAFSFGDAGRGAQWSYATEDFGTRAPIPAIPKLPAGAVIPRLAFATNARELIVNYYDKGGQAPRSAKALVGGTCVNLTKVAGSASNGSYGTTRTFPTEGCTTVVFEAVAADGTLHRWPDDGAIVVGTGWSSVNCDEFAPAPTQTCGGGTAPTPTPTPTNGPAPTPTPAGSASLKSLRVVLKPGKANASKGVVQVQATLTPLPGFDPSSGPVSFRIRFGHNGDWRADFAARCGDKPCLKPNSRSTVFTGKVGTSTLTFTRAQNGQWKVRLVSRDQTLGGVAAGPVTVTLQADAATHTGTASGKLKDSGLVAN